MNLFDICVITASTQKQARAYKALLQRRLDFGLYPREVDFKVYQDPKKGRIGTGGATLLALHRLMNDYRVRDSSEFLNSRRILMIQAGGELHDLPCYAPEGSIFAPVPVESSSVIPPVMLDLQLGLFFHYPWQDGELVIISGDVLALFDTSAIPGSRRGICGFTKPADPEQGSRHGVFQFDRNRERVTDFFHKSPAEEIRKEALLEGTGQCAVDMGMFSFSPESAGAFMKFGGSPSESNSVVRAVKEGRVRFDVYFEILTAAIQKISEASFLRRTSPASSLPSSMLKKLYRAFHPHPLAGALTSSAVFLHNGSIPEYLLACREAARMELKPFYTSTEGGEIKIKSGGSVLEHNCADTGAYVFSRTPVLLENMRNCTVEAAMGNNLLTGATHRHLQIEIPKGICLDERHIKGRIYRAVYSQGDTFHPCVDPADILFCGIPLPQWLETRGLRFSDILKGTRCDLYKARLFCPDVSDNFLSGYWEVSNDPEWSKKFKQAARASMHELNQRDDPMDRDRRRSEARIDSLQRLFGRRAGWKSISAKDFRETFSKSPSYRDLQAFCSATDNPLLKAYRTTLLGSIAPGSKKEKSRLQRISFFTQEQPFIPLVCVIREGQIVWARSPVRIDLAGGWSDIPPYTLQHGGRVVNLSVNLNGQPPLQVFCKRTARRHLLFHSIDTGLTESVNSFSQLEGHRDPSSPFALPKAALCLVGMTRKNQKMPFKAFLKALGHGMEITMLSAVPSGSGLGASSILSGTLLGALYRFFGRELPADIMARQVLLMEQMLTTQGGWQNQIGGTVGGVKYIESVPGLTPNPVVRQLDAHLFRHGWARACMTLFYMGTKRQAANIADEVVEELNEMNPSRLFTMKYIKQLALNTRDAIELRNLGGLANCISQSWEANKRIHPGTANSRVEALLEKTNPHWTGAKLMGAGGGGFVLFISGNPGQAEQLKNLLRVRFEDHTARMVDFQLNSRGLKTSVS